MSSINRKLANLISNTGDVKKAALDNAASMEAFSSVDSLPTSGLTAGDQALVGQRLYISNGSGWYNVALINATPRLTLSQDGSIELATDGATTTTITLTAADSDNSDANLALTAESGGDFFKMATVSQDSSVFTITPRSKDSATSLGWDGSSTLTFKASDGIAFASNQVTFTLSFSIANSQYTTFLMKADDDANDNQVDASSNAYTVTEYDDVTSAAFTPYHSGGYSTYFDGTGDYLTTPTNAGFNYGTGDFTIECWVYFSYSLGGGGAYRYIVAQGANTNDGCGIYIQGNNYKFWAAGAAVLDGTASGTQHQLDTWQHVAVSRSGTTIKMFVNGVEAASATNSSNIQTGSSHGLTIARWHEINDNSLFIGYIRDVRVVKGTAVYTSAFTAPTTPLTAISGTSLLACHKPYIQDGSTNDHAITIAGNVSTERFTPYTVSAEYTKAAHGGSVYFDGVNDTVSGDYFTVGAAANAALTGTFTIEGWFRLKQAYSTKTHCIMTNYDSTAGPYWSIQITSGGVLQLASATGTGLSYTLNPQPNVWYHFAFSNDTAASSGKMFVNGRLVNTYSSNTNLAAGPMGASGQPLHVGKVGNHNSQYFYGYLADIRILSGTHLRTAAFDPPTQPLTAITNTKFLLCSNKNDLWDAAGGNVIIVKDGAPLRANNTQRKWTDANNSAIRPSSWVFQTMTKPLMAGDFCIEGWVYFDTNNDPHGVFQTGSGTTAATFNYANANGCGLGLNGSTGLWRVYHAGSATNASQQASATTWHHFAYVRYNGTIKLYVDGSATDISISNTTTFTEPQITIGGYYSSAYTMSGYLQDFRISVGNARYTANFTAPTATFKG